MKNADRLAALCLVALLGLCRVAAAADSAGADPLNSPAWGVMHKVMLNGGEFSFDERVQVKTPISAEDPLNVPVAVRVHDIENIEEIVVFADLNPIQKVLVFRPDQLAPAIAFRIKVEQATPVRAAVRTADGHWYVGGRWVDAAGGGCTAPSVGRQQPDWFETLGKVNYRLWNKSNAMERLRFRVMHPMDTGLAPGIPAFYIERLALIDSDGVSLAEVDTFEPISENPYLTFDFLPGQDEVELTLRGRDNNGNRIEALLAP